MLYTICVCGRFRPFEVSDKDMTKPFVLPLFLTAGLVVCSSLVMAQGQGEQEKSAPPKSESATAQAPVTAAPKTNLPGVANPEQPAAAQILPTTPSDPLKMAAPATSAKLPMAVSPGERTYTLGAEDALMIQVWNNKDLSGAFVVRPDGKISMGLIGDVMVAGLTPEQLGVEVARRLKDGGYILNPTVTVNVTGFNSKKFYIQGEVNRTGAFPLVVPTTVMQALVNAGGFKDFANQKSIIIQRGTERLKFNYKWVIAGKHLEQNVYLEPNDLIIVK